MFAKQGKTLFKLSALAVATAAALTLAGCNDDNNDDETAGDDDTVEAQTLTRLATVPLGAEVTGLFVTADGDLFFNAQHPDDTNTEEGADGTVFNAASVGVVRDYLFTADKAPFEALSLPASDAEKQVVRTAVGSYQVIGQNGDTFAGAPDGGLGAIVADDDGAIIKVSNDPDFNAFVSTGDNEGYLFTNWEDRPGGMSRIKLGKDGDGAWSVLDNDVMMLDFGSVMGTWVNCFGSLSPWNTPLTSEELYFDDTADWNNPGYSYISDVEALEDYLGVYPNPYNYGFIVEITDPTGTPMPVKHFAMGRFSHENSVVMPDNKTVYLSDDGTGTVFFKFVADTAGDLSAGTLYAAEATQDATTDPTVTGFDLNWIELAQGNETDIATWIADYDGLDQTDYVDGSTSYISDEEVCDWAESKKGTDLDCDADTTADANPFGDDRVAFLESRKAAAALGATNEFRKMEGVNISRAGATDGSVPYAYMAMSEFNATMSDGTGAIQLDPANADCGAVYRMALDDDFNIARMEPVLVGGPYDGTATANTCDVDNIANPDNIFVLDSGKVIVGEDSGEHENNMIWLYDPEA